MVSRPVVPAAGDNMLEPEQVMLRGLSGCAFGARFLGLERLMRHPAACLAQ
jgi:hypothetical protein